MSEFDNDKLWLDFHGRIIDNLGIQMYQSPVAAIAEIVSNSWDADADRVDIRLPGEISPNAILEVRDNGIGMTFSECQKRFLKVGYDRRKGDPDAVSPGKGRPVLGRKGIGKFAGFGIAEIIEIETVSGETGEKTVFELDLSELRNEGEEEDQDNKSSSRKEIKVLTKLGPDNERKADKGTIVRLKKLRLDQRPSEAVFGRSMARRFLLQQRVADFEVLVNGVELPESEELENAQYIFPQCYEQLPKEMRPVNLEIKDGWGIETLLDGKTIKWRFVFYEETIHEEELRGIAVFAKGKLAQVPFFFNLTGGLGAQHGLEYLSGRVEADFLDSFDTDLIATERQRVNWQLSQTKCLAGWGQTRVKQLIEIWKNLRAQTRAAKLENKIAGFSARLEKLPKHERRTVRRAVLQIAKIPTLTNQQFEELGSSMLTAWEQGRLLELISEISDADAMSEATLLDVLLETQALTALNTAEAVKTKLQTVGGLKSRIEERQLENAVRDYISSNPWLISPEWETFRVEQSVRNLAAELADKSGIKGDDYKGRVDLVLSSGNHLLLLEFMRPDLTIDWDHLNRFERYVIKMRNALRARTGGPFSRVTGYIVADRIEKDPDIVAKLESMRSDDMYAFDWDLLFMKAISSWEEFLYILSERNPGDERLRLLLDAPGLVRLKEVNESENSQTLTLPDSN